MNFLIAFACVLAVASAEYGHYQGPIHIPVIGPHGVPVEPVEVQHARAAHLAAHGHGSHYGVVHAPAYAHGPAYAHNAVISASHYEIPQIAPNGQPLDTAEVSAAKAHHYAAYAEAAARNGAHGYAPYAVHGGVAETPEVQHAKAAHFAAHAEAATRNAHGHGFHHYRRRRSAYGLYGYAHAVPVIGHNGVPLDTPEVQHAKAAHFAAHAEAAHRSGPYPVAHAVQAYAYPQHIPVIGHNGVPVDTPEVQHAKAAHFAAYAKAAYEAAANPDYSEHATYAAPWAYHAVPQIGHNGTPLDTPEVAAAKAAHLHAHAAARAHHY